MVTVTVKLTGNIPHTDVPVPMNAISREMATIDEAVDFLKSMSTVGYAIESSSIEVKP